MLTQNTGEQQQTRSNPCANESIKLPTSPTANHRVNYSIRKLSSGSSKEVVTEGNKWQLSSLNAGRSFQKQKLEHEILDAKEPIVLPPYYLNRLSGIDDTDDVDPDEIPPPERSIIHNKSTAALVCDGMVCRKCKRVGAVVMSFPSIGVQTIPRLHCRHCVWTKDADIPKVLSRQASYKKAIVDYDTNIKFGLSFVANGDGGRHAQRFLSLMSLPNATTMGKSTFPKIERVLSDPIRNITERLLVDNLVTEVKLSYGDALPEWFEAWQLAVVSSDPYDLEKPFISVGMDMGWQKRASGHRYDSSSGHAFLVGMRTRKPVAMCLKSAFCRVCCFHINQRNLEPEDIPEHECMVNHSGSAGSMEAASLIEMCEYLYDNLHTGLATVVTDDDSKMKSQCQWSNEDFLQHIGKPQRVKKWLIVGSKPDS